MGFQKRIVLLLGIVLPYMCVVVGVAFYYVVHPGPIPRWVVLTMSLMFILTVIGGAVAFFRVAKYQVGSGALDLADLRRDRTAKGLKVGLVVWTAILLNDIRMLAEDSASWKYAIPGLVVVLLMIVVFWTSLRRLKRNGAPLQ